MEGEEGPSRRSDIRAQFLWRKAYTSWGSGMKQALWLHGEVGRQVFPQGCLINLCHRCKPPEKAPIGVPNLLLSFDLYTDSLSLTCR